MTRAHYGVAALLSIILGWFIYDALGSLIGFPAELAAVGLQPSPILVVLLWAGLLAPVVLFVAAILLTRRQPLPHFVLVIIVALASSAALRLSIIALASGSTAL